MAGARARDALRRSVGALTVTALLGAAVAVGAGLTLAQLCRTLRAPAGERGSVLGTEPIHARPSRPRRPGPPILPTPRTSPTPMARPREAAPSALPASPSPLVPTPMGASSSVR